MAVKQPTRIGFSNSNLKGGRLAALFCDLVKRRNSEPKNRNYQLPSQLVWDDLAN